MAIEHQTTDALDVHVAIIFQGQAGISAGILADIVTTVNAAAFKAAQEELASIRDSELLPSVAVDAALERIRTHKSDAIRMTRVRNGSIVLVGVVTGLTIWLLQQTVGETLSEAWKATDLHAVLREWTADRINTKTRRLAQLIDRDLKRRRIDARATAQLETPNDPDAAVVVWVGDERAAEPTVPTPSEALRRVG